MVKVQRAIRTCGQMVSITILANVLCSFALFAQNQYTIYGVVRQPNGLPVRGAVVELSGQGTSLRAFADDLGRYELQGVARGNYRMTVSNPADPKQSMEPLEVDTSQFASNRVLVNLFLRNASQVEAPKAPAPGVVSLGEAGEQVPKPAQKAFGKAVELRGKGKNEEALKNFNKAVEIYPAYFRALTERGHLYITLQRPDDARKDFAQALELNPRYGPALRGAGICEFQQGKFAEAVQTLTRATDAEPGNATNYLFIGIADAALNRRDQARSALTKALSIDPAGSARAHVHLANLSMKEGRPKEAIQEIEAYLDAAPKAPDADHFRKVLDQLRAQNPK